MLSLLSLFIPAYITQDLQDGLYYKEKEDTSFMYHILEDNVIESTFSGNATKNNGQRYLLEGPSKPYTTIEFTILRLKPSADPVFAYNENPIIMSGTAMNQFESQNQSFYDYLETNSNTKSEFENLDEKEKAYWKDVHFVFQSWCEDPVCPPDESILYKVRLLSEYIVLVSLAPMCSIQSKIQRRSHNRHRSRGKQDAGSP